MKVAIITPTIGSGYLKQCLESVQNQSYENLTHYVFLDGSDTYDKVKSSIYETCGKKTVKTICLDENVGNGWYGHRVYAASSFLVNADVICYLDEDNWVEENHVQSIVDTISKGYKWVYSLRKIFDKESNYVCDDNCESLGEFPVYFNDEVYHIDTSCFGVRRDVATRIGHAWYAQWGADRQFFNTLKKVYPEFTSTKTRSVCYRLDSNPNSVNREFFEKGNKVMFDKYSGNFPWLSEGNTEILIGPNIKIIA